MAAGMSVGRSPFLRIDPPRNRRGDEDGKTALEDMKKQRIIDERKALFAKVGNSDHSLLVAAYMMWEDTSAGGGGRKRVCDSLGLSFNGMRDMMQLVKQYDSSLSAAGYVGSRDADRNMKSWSIIRAVAVAALAPSQLVRIQRSTTKYVETVEGAVEKDGEAKELKFFIRGSIDEQQQEASKQDERVFIHPSSFNFSVGNYYCPFLVFHSMVRTSKPFLRDVSECSAYSLLLFGGSLEVRATEGVVVIDGWVKLDAKARIAALIGGLRQRVDQLMEKKIEDPTFEVANTNEMKLIVKLLLTDGHG
jgi:ATP-dependent RNA helicase DHX57